MSVSLDGVSLTSRCLVVFGVQTHDLNILRTHSGTVSAVNTGVLLSLEFLPQPVLLSRVRLLALPHPSERAASGRTARSLPV